MSIDERFFTITTCVGDVVRVERVDDRLYPAHYVNARPGWWYRVQDEGTTWVRGQHALESPAANALRVAWALSGSAATYAVWDR